MTVTEEYVSINTAAQLLGCHRMTITRRLARRDIPYYQNGADHRTRLIRLSDVLALREPRPISKPARTTTGGVPVA